MNRTKRKLLSGVLAAALLLQTATPATVFAAEPAAKTIVGFSALEQTEYTLPLGADETQVEELLATFPEIMTAEVEYIVTEEVTQPPAPPVADSRKPETLPPEDTDEADPPIDDASSESDAEQLVAVFDSGESGNSTEQPKTATDGDADEREPSDNEESLPGSSLPETSIVEKVVSEQVELAVTWENNNPLTTEKAGQFTCTAVLSDTDKGRYDLAVGVSLPELTVTVAEPLAMMSPRSGYTYDLSQGSITIETGTDPDTHKVTHSSGVEDNIPKDTMLTITSGGVTTANTITVSGGTHNITLSDVTITSDAAAPLALSYEVNVTLTLAGSNSLTATSNYAGISVSQYTQLEITGEGSLEATGGSGCPGIGKVGDSVIGGSITISSGRVTANGGTLAAGIGTGGSTRNLNNITISGGTVTANGGVGTGSGNGGGAGIGGGRASGTGGSITISGGMVTANGADGGAGIGGGFGGDSGTITISGGTVIANGSVDDYTPEEYPGAGIGAGSLSLVPGSFTTGTSGNAFIKATSISDSTYKTADSTQGIIFNGKAGTVYGSLSLSENATIEVDETLAVSPGATLTIPMGVTLQNKGIFLLNFGTVAGAGALSGSGKFRRTITAAADIAAIPDQVYTGSTIEPAVSFTDNTIMAQTFTGVSDGYTKSYESNTNAGTAKVVFTKNSDSAVKIEKEFNITQSGTVFDGGVTADKATYGYGDTITVTAKPKATGIAPAVAGRAAVPSANQMALYVKANGVDVQISEPAAADASGVYTMTCIANTDNHFAVNGTTEIIAKYVGNNNMANAEGSVTVTVTADATVTKNGATTYHATLQRAMDSIAADETGTVTLLKDVNLEQTSSLTVREGKTLTIPTGVTLQNSGTLLLDGGTVAGAGTLSGSGKFHRTILAAADIAAIPDQVYTGSAIEPAVSFTDNTYLAQTFISVSDGYTQSFENNSNVGTAKVVYTKNSDSTVKIEKEFNITKSGTTFDGGVTADKAAYTYGDIITIKAKPKATGTAPAMAGRAAPIVNQMALYVGDKRISEPATPDANGVYTMTYDTSKKDISIGSGNIITAKYIGTANMADYSADVTITLNPKTITSATVSADATKTYDGTTAFSNVVLTPNASDIVSGDIVTATASGTVSDANVGTAKAFTATAVTLGGTHTSYYSLAATAVSGNVAITKATATGMAQTFNFVENLARPDYTYDLSNLLPGVTPPASLGIVTYSTKAGEGAVLSGSATISGSTITLPVKAVATDTIQNVTISITSDNYTIADVTLTLTAVDKLPLNIAASITGRAYNAKALAYTGTPIFTKATDGTAVTGVTYKVEYEGVAPTVYPKSTTAPTNAGTYTATITVDGDSANIYMGSVDIVFTIGKAALTVKADDKSALVGGAKPTYTATTTGLVNDETISGITFTDDNAITIAKGSFIITPAGGTISGGGNDNYKIIYQTGTLTVNIDVTVINTAIAGANSAKNGIITSNQPASSVTRGTKFVTTAEMNALNSAIGTATVAKATVNTATEAQAAAKALNGAVATFTAAIKTGTYTSGGGSGDSAGNSSGGNTTITTPPVTPGNPNPPTQGNITVLPTISGDTATVTVPKATVKDAITKAQAEAKKNGKTDNGIWVEIKGDTKNATNLTANLPKASIDALVTGGVKEAKITSGVATISLSLDTLKQIQKQTGTDVTVTATKVANSALSNEAKALVGNRPVYDLSITGKDGTKVTSFGNGTASVSIPYTLGANETAGNVVAYYINSAGKATELPNSVYDAETKTLRFVTSHFSVYAVSYKEKATTFTDIADHWAKDSIEFVAARGLLAGTGESKFSPNSSMTRGMFVTALGRLAGADVNSYKQSSFTDVNAGTYYLGYIEWAVKNNIMQGMGNGKFAPDKAISREQMAVIMQNYAKAMGFDLPRAHAQNTFADNAKISGYASNAIKVMQMAGVLAGKNGNKFDPQGTATRAEVSAVLKRFVELAISIDSAQGWMLNDSGKWMFYENGRPVIRTKTISGVNYTFDANGETADLPKNMTYGSR